MIMAHTANKHCDSKHCKIHWIWSFKLKNHVKFPEEYKVLSSRVGWQSIIVYCGPGAYYPTKPKKEETTAHVPPF